MSGSDLEKPVDPPLQIQLIVSVGCGDVCGFCEIFLPILETNLLETPLMLMRQFNLGMYQSAGQIEILPRNEGYPLCMPYLQLVLIFCPMQFAFFSCLINMLRLFRMRFEINAKHFVAARFPSAPAARHLWNGSPS